MEALTKVKLLNRGFKVNSDSVIKNYIGINCIYSIFIEDNKVYLITEQNEPSLRHKTELSREFIEDLAFIGKYIY